MTARPPDTRRFERLLAAAEERPLYIWGAGNQGRGLCRTLERRGVPVEGFIDASIPLQGTTAMGRRIAAPGEVLRDENSHDKRPFIVIATFFFEEQVRRACARAGLTESVDFLPYTAIKPFDYSVDISGMCNLRCISCPRARPGSRGRREGFMTPAVFEKVLDKILHEDPLAGNVQLYQWGEPLLNPNVAAIIAAARARGVECAVSSNLNDDRNLEAAVRAGPGWFRVSVSGWGANYELTHSGGKWERFHGNFLRLAELRRRYQPDMKTEVYYHLYKHNQGEDATRVAGLCAEAMFEFHPVYAYLISLDDALGYLEGKPLPEAAARAKEMLALEFEEGMARAREQANEACLTLRCIHVNWDLSVSNCMMFFDAEGNRAASNFLDTPLEEISRRRASSALCARCRKQALHRYCGVYTTAPARPGGNE